MSKDGAGLHVLRKSAEALLARFPRECASHRPLVLAECACSGRRTEG